MLGDVVVVPVFFFGKEIELCGKVLLFTHRCDQAECRVDGSMVQNWFLLK